MIPICKAKRLDNKEWVEGYYVLTACNEHCIYATPVYYENHHSLFIEVDPFTVCMGTGLADKNGVKIWEGDLLRFPADVMNDKDNYIIYEVFWHNNDCADRHIGFQMNRVHYAGNLCGTSYIPDFIPKNVSKMEIIGNIYENPELIENFKR